MTVDRIRSHATKLGLTHLTDVVTPLVQRAETEQLGHLDFVDLLLEKSSDCERAAGFATL